MVQGAANTDSLLIFFEKVSGNVGDTRDAVVMRYQEGGTSELAFDDELSVVAVFSGVTDFDAANIA